jgi:NADH dehydrogenase
MKRVVIFGGRGFVGEGIVDLLRKEKYEVVTVDRKQGGKNHIQADILKIKDVEKSIHEGDVVINLVGLTPTKIPFGVSYKQVHVDGVKNVISACKKNKCTRLIHMSALGAYENSENEYLKTKGEGEKLVLNSSLTANIFCPSLIYDRENELIKLMEKFSFTGFFPKIPARFQPVYREDVARLFLLAVQGKMREKKIEIGGPEILSIFDMARTIYEGLGKSVHPIPFLLVKTGFKFASLIGFFGIGPDQVKNLITDNVTDSEKVKKYVDMMKFRDWVQETYSRKKK